MDLIIGSADSRSEYQFSVIKNVRANQNGHIFIADKSGMQIMVFNKEGIFVDEYGKRGRGPGELSEITSFDVFDGKLFVYDRANQRFTIFTTPNDFETFPVHSELNGFFEATKMLVQDDEIYIYSKDHSIRNKDGYIIHQFNHKFSYEGVSIVREDQLWDMNNSFEAVQSTMGSVHIIHTEKNFFFSPHIYTGYIQKTSHDNDYGVEKINGTKPEKMSYEILPATIKNLGAPNSEAYSGREGKLIYKVFNRSIGLHNWGEYIVNFLLSDKDESLTLSVDLFHKDGRFIRNYPVRNYSIEEKPLYKIKIPHSDSQGNFYLIENYDIPVVKRFQLEITD